MLFTVTATIQAPNNDPVDVRWGTGVDAINAASCVAQILAQFSTPDVTIPRSVRTELVAINVVPA